MRAKVSEREGGGIGGFWGRRKGRLDDFEEVAKGLDEVAFC